MLHRLNLLELAICALLLVGCNSGSTFDVEELHHPRGLAVTADLTLLIADAGNGRILGVTAGETPYTIADGLPVTWDGGPGADMIVGVSGLALDGRDIVYVVGEFRGDRFRRAYRLSPDGITVPLTNAREELPGEGLVNPYDVVVLDGNVFVSDAGANAVFRVESNGEVKPYARLAEIPVPGAVGPQTTDAVPTGLAAGPDGALYLATLAGAPYEIGTAAIYRLDDVNDDGDALDDGEISVAVEGLTAATDLTFTNSGWLIVTELSRDMASLYTDLTPEHAAELPGRVTAWCGPGQSSTSMSSVLVADHVSSPTSVASIGEVIVVAEELADRITQLHPKHRPWAEPCQPDARLRTHESP